MTTIALASASNLADAGETAGSIALAVFAIAIALGGIILFVAGLVSALRSRNYATGGKAIWILLMLAFPFLGPLVWFIWGRNSAIQAAPHTPAA
ncbi:PLD nuclease N-terminal domain-containing protein [Nocardia sp. NPDC052566]|uniref:PLD nuclease N-terminal domain-containing protein n=1 Tax=Nocardia sp. NPDC052566 TaxID=3364330 RepID=UPI0037C9C9DB